MRKLLLVFLLVSFSKNYAQTDYTYVYNNDSIIRKGINFYSEKKYDEAIKEYQRITKTDPKYLTAQYEIGLTLNAQNKKSELKTFLEDLYAKGKMHENPELYRMYAIFLSDEKEYESSEKIFKEGEKYLSNSSSYLYNFALLYVRKKETQKAIELLQRIITNDPNHGPSHYFLGIIAFENGKITEGTLALMSYLIIAPTGQYANQAILQLNANYGQNYLTENKFVFSKSGDNFEEIETILRNQLPLKKVYKVKSSIDDAIIRQVQAVAEYAAEHKMGDGFFETTYIPWVKHLIEKNQFEGYSYYMLLSMEDKIGKELTKQKKKIIAFRDNYMLGDFWNVFGKRKLDIFGNVQDVIVTTKNERPYIIGPQVNGEFEGKCKYLNAYGNLNGEINFKNGELDGLQKYYNEKGNLIEEKTFLKGKLNGTRTTYYENGNLELIENYKDDLLEGISTSYFPNGGKSCEINFINGERNGTLICLYQTGIKKKEVDYANGKLSGKFNTYNEAGDLTETYNCADDKIEGNYFEFYDGKIIKSEAVYKNGLIDEGYKSYYSNKTLNRENSYLSGKIKQSIDYYENGKKSDETFYNNKGEIETYSYFDNDGNKYFEEKYKSGELKSGLQFLKNVPKPTEVNLTKKTFEIKNFDNTLRVKGAFEKGAKSGEWNYFYTSGVQRLKDFYVKGKANGLSANYNVNGSLSNITNYKNDTISGVYEIYSGNKVNQIYNYEKGEQNGPFKTFYSDGTVSTEGYLIESDVYYDKYTYFQNGNISIIDRYIDGQMTLRKTFNPKGILENEIDYKNKTGKFTYSFNNGVYTKTYDLKNGLLHGKLISKDKFKTNIMDAEYLNGEMHNIYKFYSPLGSLYIENNYYCGKLNGLSKKYDHVGNLKLTGEYTFGVENGKTIRYYHNKAKLSEYNQQNGSVEGENIYYNQKGETLVIVGYENGIAKYYIQKSKTGELNENVVIENQTAQISSSYPNGKIAIQFNINKGNTDGKFIINNNDGKPEFECTYDNNVLTGERIEYYSNGKPYKKEHFKNSEYDGLQEYFKEDGKPWAVIALKNDELHGNTLIYNAGKLTQTKKYDSDELVEIIK
ncbi:tetratricopeptide repeat protein [Flavobacterium piscis]|uniref:Antitoxin component YwqK of YwqJK toxin-antitoxin module/Tfp pilus assembly protein PilF n=1 Tax=Flavobacterium piscis TaxID=1114874 RepID=A0ABU1Y8G4_9FLAO|nr:tetratricopeptide repeat protein [Flavobacterium piscis]MDR7210532.1 antitoxin component YwqK of YwqJK toxin-antitoxin module/Tfp pilus assembly protein PilF [Flavobacterium piscis]